MDIDNMTIKEFKELSALFSGKTTEKIHGAVGVKCIVRTYASGVHFGEVVSVSSNDGRSRCELKNSRRLWKWHGGLSLSEISINGVDKSKSRIAVTVPVQFLEDAIEFIPSSDKATWSIEGADDDKC